MTFGIDIGTTSVSGVAVGEDGRVLSAVTRAHGADLNREGEDVVAAQKGGVDEQSPERLLAAAKEVLTELERLTGRADRIGWTGQMHGVVAVNERLEPITPFVTWRDARRYGGNVMEEWRKAGLAARTCLTAPGYVIARLEGRCVIDPTFLESWHVREGSVPAEWIPEVAEGVMLGDNQAGVYAAQKMRPGCAVVNIGTSGQLSVVGETGGDCEAGAKVERRIYPGGKTLLCRASTVGGQALARLREELGLSWEELNARAEGEERIRSCLDGIVDDLAGGLDLSGVTGLVGVGNALRLNPALRRAVERRFGLACIVPDVTEMAACGAAVYAEDCFRKREEKRQ